MEVDKETNMERSRRAPTNVQPKETKTEQESDKHGNQTLQHNSRRVEETTTGKAERGTKELEDIQPSKRQVPATKAKKTMNN